MNTLQFAGYKVEIAGAYVEWAVNNGSAIEQWRAQRTYCKCMSVWYALQGMADFARVEANNAVAFNRLWVAAVERQRRLEQHINF